MPTHSHRRSAGPVAAFVAGLIVAALIGLGIWLAASGHSGKPSASASASSPVASPAPTPSGAPSQAPATGHQGATSVVKVVCPPATRRVTTAVELQDALGSARPGESIEIASGTYKGNFIAKTKATAARPIYLCGPRGAVLDGGGTKAGYVLYLNGAAFWRVSGFTVRDGQKGVVADRTTSSVIANLDVGQLGDEGIHLRAFSTDDIVENNVVHDTGLHSGKFGEGIYVGSARSNWCTYSACNPDRSDDNLVADNTISNTTAENLDIKEGTTGGYVTGNQFDAIGMTSADSWVDVKGNGWTITGNTGSSTGTSSIVDGYQTHEILAGWGTGNAFVANTGTLRSTGYAIHLTPVNANQVACDDHITGPAQGLSNIACTDTATALTSSTSGTGNPTGTASPTSSGRHKHHHDHA